MNKRIFITLAAAALCSASQAEFYDGNYLHKLLSGDKPDQLIAIGYITGVADAVDGIVYCAPVNIRAGQIVDMVQQHLQNNPAIRHNSADRVVSFVLRSAWPCAERKQRGGGTGV